MPIVVNGVTLPAYADPADVPAAMRAMSESLLPKSGGTMIGLLNMGGNRITGIAAPTSADDAATKQYTDGKVGSVVWNTLPGKPSTFPPSTHGPHPTADMWTTARTLTLAGDVTGAVNIRGNANVTMNTAIDATKHVHSVMSMTSLVANAATLGNVTVTGSFNMDASPGIVHAPAGEFTAWMSTNQLRPRAAWPSNNENAPLRWMGVNNAVSFGGTTSSVAYKERVIDIDFSKSVFARLRPVHYRYRADHPFKERFGDSWDRFENPEIGRMGFLYEQVKEVAPHWTYEMDGAKSVSYDGMIPDFMAWATAAINYLVAKVKDHE